MARAVGVVALALGIAATLPGCFGSNDEDQDPLPAPSTSVHVVRDDGALPAGCGPREVGTRVVQFLDAITRGDVDALDRLIAGADRFQWFTSNAEGSRGTSSFTAFGETVTIEGAGGMDDRSRVLRYLEARHEQGERVRLLHLGVNRVPAGSWLPREVGTVVGLEFSVERVAPDLGPLGGGNRIATGKGGVACSDSTILVWAMGLDSAKRLPDRAIEVCGRRDTPNEPAGVVVCTV